VISAVLSRAVIGASRWLEATIPVGFTSSAGKAEIIRKATTAEAVNLLFFIVHPVRKI
jgi:hypothetical protein